MLGAFVVLSGFFVFNMILSFSMLMAELDVMGNTKTAKVQKVWLGISIVLFITSLILAGVFSGR